MRILAVDHGERNIGLAISDATGTIANPLYVFPHLKRIVDAAQVAERAIAQEVQLIIVGQSFDEDGKPNLSGKRAAKFAAALREQTQIPVELWEEAFTTQDARSARIAMGVRQKKRSGHMDDLAATVLLQSYLDAHPDRLP